MMGAANAHGAGAGVDKDGVAGHDMSAFAAACKMVGVPMDMCM